MIELTTFGDSIRAWALVILTACVLVACTTLSVQTPQAPQYQIAPPPPNRLAETNSVFESVVRIRQGNASGTGFVVGIAPDCVYFMTAYHVVDEAGPIWIGGREAEVLATAPSQDLAVLRQTNEGDYWRVLPLVGVDVGDRVFAVGYSRWMGEPVSLIHTGWVVSLDFLRDETWVITHNAGGRGGMSGGPLFNTRWEVVGVCSFFADMGLKRRSPNASELCAIPATTALTFWKAVVINEIAIPETP